MRSIRFLARSLVIVAVAAFVVAAAVMFWFEALPHVPSVLLAACYGMVVAVTVSGALYFFGYRPLLAEFVARERELLQAHESKARATTRYQAIFENAMDGILQMTPVGHCLTANPTMARIVGCESAAELMLKAPDMVQQLHREMKQRLESGRLPETKGIVRGCEFQLGRKDGIVIWVSMNARVVRDSIGNALFYEGTFTDITGRKRAEETLRSSEEVFRVLTESAPDAILILNADRTVRYVNPALERLLGNPANYYVGKDAFAFVHPDDLPKTTAALMAGIKNPGTIQIVEHRLRHQDDSWRIVESSGVSLLENSRFKGIIINFRDVTERTRAEEALRESEERFRGLSDCSPLGVFVTDGEGRWIYANPRCRAIFGVTLMQSMGYGWADSIYPDDRPAVMNEWLASIRDGREFFREFRLKPGNASVHWICLRSAKMITDDNQVTGYVATVEDITQRRQAEETQRRLSAAVEQAAEAILITDNAGTIAYVNPAFEKVTGYTREEAIGQNPRLLKSGRHDEAFYRQMWQALDAGDVWRGHLINKRKDGTLFEEEATISAVRDGSGNVVNYVAVKRDVTHEIQLEAQFHQAQKMEDMGRLAGGVAHDFNNLLMAIIGYSEMMLANFKADDPLRGYAEIINHAGEQAAGLTRQLLAFSRKQALEPRVLDLNKLVQNTRKMLRRLISEDIELIVVTSEAPAKINADPGQIEQVIMNLTVNARDAMPAGGKLTIETSHTTLDETYCRQYEGLRPGPYVMLSVTDTGVGMTAEVLSRLFEPFFTTKEKGKGTGLGLATVYGIIKQSGGHISVHSEPGRGATFKIHLPATTGKPADPETFKATKSLRRENKTILIVEDDDGVRKFLQATLTAEGHTVLQARSGNEAIEQFGKHTGPIHLMISDLVMPGMRGGELFELLKPMKPEMKVLFISGYIDDSIIPTAEAGKTTPFLQKPFSSDVLARKIREILDA